MNNQTLEILLKLKDEASKGLAAFTRQTQALAADTQRFATKSRADLNALFSSWAGHDVELTKSQERLQQSLGATAKAVGILGGAAAAGGAALIALGKRGSDVAGVEGAFRALSKAANQNADEMLAASRNATRGLVSDFDLMASANKALLLGLPITAQSMDTMGRVAVTLGQAMQVGPAQAMNDLIVGLGRGSVEILDNLGITVRASEAYATYAASIGKAPEQLTAAEQRLAVYTSAMGAARAKLDEMGETQLSFGLRLTQVTTQLQNFIDNLGKAVATSPAVNTALKTLAEGMTSAFGHSAGAVKTLMALVDSFAVGVVKAASYAVSAAGFIGQAWNGLNVLFNSTLAGLADKLGNLLRGLEKLTAPFVKMSAAQAALVGPMAQTMRDLGLAVAGSAKTVSAWGDGFKKNAADALTATGKLDNTVRTATQGLDRLALTMSEAAKRGAEAGAAIGGEGGAPGGGPSAASGVKRLSEAAREALADLKKLDADFRKVASGGGGFVVAGAKELFGGEDDQRKIAEFEKWLAGIREDAAKKAAEGQKKIADATEAAKKTQEEQAEALRRYVQQLGDLRYLIDSIADLFVTMGGNIDSTFGKLLRGASLGLGAMEQLAKATSKTQKAAILAQTAAGAYEGGSVMGGALSGAMAGSAFGPWGAAIGGVAGGILGLFGGKSKIKQQLADLRQQLLDQFGGSMDALRKKAAALGVDISRAFTTQNPRELQATIEKLNTAMEEQKKKLEALSIAAQGFVGLAQEWGKQIAESGATEEMQAQFDRLGLYATAIFAGIVRETGDVIGAFKQIGEGLSEMRKRQEEFGLSASETTQKLLDLYGIVEDNEGAANALSFLNQMMTGLIDAGMRSQQLFSAFGSDAVKIFNDLVAGGATSNQALALMQPTLQRLWEMQRDYGYEVDETTQALLDQAEEQGLVGDNMRSVNDKILQVLLAIGEALGAKIPDALRRTGDAAEREFGRFRDAAEGAGDAMPGGGYYPQEPPDAGKYGLPGYATGGRVSYTPGGKAVRVAEEQTENILTDAQLAGIMKRAGVAGGGGLTSLTIDLNLDGQRMGSYVVKLTNEGLADGRVRVPARAIAERNG